MDPSQMLERAPDEADVRAVAAFLVHLAALFCFGELGLKKADVKVKRCGSGERYSVIISRFHKLRCNFDYDSMVASCTPGWTA